MNRLVKDVCKKVSLSKEFLLALVFSFYHLIYYIKT